MSLDDEKTMLEEFGKSQEEIWQDDIRLFPLEPFTPFWCTTLNWPTNVNESSWTYFLVLNLTFVSKLFLEISPYGKSSIFARPKGDRTFDILQGENNIKGK